MTNILVDSDAVLNATVSIKATVDRIRGEVSALTAQLSSLEPVWQGQVATAFQAIMADWQATQLRVEEGLAAINNSLSIAGTQYAETESANARLFR